MWLRTSGLACLLAGCGTVFSLDELDPYTPPDVTGVVRLSHPEPNGTGGYMATDIPFPFSLDLELQGDPPTPLVVDAQGNFSFFWSSEEPYRLVFHSELDEYPVEYQLTSERLELWRYIYDRFEDRKAVTAETPVTFDMGAGSVGGFAAITSTGIRSHTRIEAASVNTATVNWQQASVPDDGTPALLDAAHGDRVYWLHFEANNPVAMDYYRAIEMYAADVTMTSGQLTRVPVSGSAQRTPVVLDNCVHLDVPRVMELERVKGELAPLRFGNLKDSGTWSIDAVPLLRHGHGLPLPIVLAHEAGMQESLDVQYSMPYAGEGQVLHLEASVFRVFTAPGASKPTPGLFPMGTVTYAPIVSSQCSTSASVVSIATGAIALPTAFALNRVVISADNTAVAVPRDGLSTLEVTVGAGAMDDLTVVLYEVVRSGADESALEPLYQWVTPSKKIAIDPSLLVKGHAYTFLVTVRTGLMGADTGDYSKPTYPMGRGRSYSPTFIVE